MLTHVVAVLGLALLCGVWVLVQRLGSRDGGRGGCSACASKRECSESD